MNRRLLIIGAACVVAWSYASGAVPPSEEAKEQVLRVDQEWANAEIQRDAGALGRILDGNFIAVYGSGKVVDKETFIKDVIGDGTDRMRSQDMSDVTVRVRVTPRWSWRPTPYVGLTMVSRTSRPPGSPPPTSNAMATGWRWLNGLDVQRI